MKSIWTRDILQQNCCSQAYAVGEMMKVSYKKLWKLLIDRDMTRTELRLQAGISSVSLAKLGKDETVTTNVLVKVCTALGCNIGDIMDIVPEEKNTKKIV